jgi:UPF0755 protein
MRNIFLILIGFVVVGVLGVAGLSLQFISSGASSSAEKEVFEVTPGASFARVASELEQRGFVTSAFKFKIYAKLTGKTGQIRVGEYELSKQMSPNQILSKISSGISIQRTFTIPEGQNMYDVAEILSGTGIASKDRFLQLFRDRTLTEKYLQDSIESFEGYLFPETYSYTKYTSAEQILEMMVKRFLNVWGEVESMPHGMTRHQVVTLASVIEKETGAPGERGLIASVFHNRLKKRMRLQSDPTILYGILVETGVMKKNISKSDITRSTPYNTYTVAALPAGPIANPGKESLMAAMNPLHSDFLFFVSRNDGTHVFTKNYQDHQKAVRAYQLDSRAREGRSWRDLNKKKN